VRCFPQTGELGCRMATGETSSGVRVFVTKKPRGGLLDPKSPKFRPNNTSKSKKEKFRFSEKGK
jgi:hypothetical protein